MNQRYNNHGKKRIQTVSFLFPWMLLTATTTTFSSYSAAALVQAFSLTPQLTYYYNDNYNTRHKQRDDASNRFTGAFSYRQQQRQLIRIKRSSTRQYATPFQFQLSTTTTNARLIRDLIVLASCGWLLVPFVQQQLRRRVVEHHKTQYSLRSKAARMILHALVQLCQVGAVLYALDAIQLVVVMLGHSTLFPRQACTAAGSTWWCTEQVIRVQQYLLLQSQRNNNNNKTQQRLQGRWRVADRFGKVLWRALGVHVWLDWMNIRLPPSLWAWSGTTTLIISLAFQDLAKSVVSGLFLVSSNRFNEGDGIEFDGLKGKIMKQGLLETIIRTGDEVLVSVPTEDLDQKQLVNRSRVYTSQVALNLRVHYDHVSQLSTFVRDVRLELQQSCPKLITDDYRPFRVHWTDYETDHLTVTIDSYYRILLGSDEYWDNRVEMLSAINRVGSRNGIRFAQAEGTSRDQLTTVMATKKEEYEIGTSTSIESNQDSSVDDEFLQSVEVIVANELADADIDNNNMAS